MLTIISEFVDFCFPGRFSGNCWGRVKISANVIEYMNKHGLVCPENVTVVYVDENHTDVSMDKNIAGLTSVINEDEMMLVYGKADDATFLHELVHLCQFKMKNYNDKVMHAGTYYERPEEIQAYELAAICDEGTINFGELETKVADEVYVLMQNVKAQAYPFFQK